MLIFQCGINPLFFFLKILNIFNTHTGGFLTHYIIYSRVRFFWIYIIVSFLRPFLLSPCVIKKKKKKKKKVPYKKNPSFFSHAGWTLVEAVDELDLDWTGRAEGN